MLPSAKWRKAGCGLDVLINGPGRESSCGRGSLSICGLAPERSSFRRDRDEVER